MQGTHNSSKLGWYILTVVLLLLGVRLYSMYFGAPSETDARDVISRRIARDSQGQIRLLSVRKINGARSGNSYQMQCTVVIQFDGNGSWYQGIPGDVHISYNFSGDSISQGAGSLSAFAASFTGGSNVHKGESRSVTDYCLFEKTERGWQCDGQIY